MAGPWSADPPSQLPCVRVCVGSRRSSLQLEGRRSFTCCSRVRCHHRESIFRLTVERLGCSRTRIHLSALRAYTLDAPARSVVSRSCERASPPPHTIRSIPTGRGGPPLRRADLDQPRVRPSIALATSRTYAIALTPCRPSPPPPPSPSSPCVVYRGPLLSRLVPTRIAALISLSLPGSCHRDDGHDASRLISSFRTTLTRPLSGLRIHRLVLRSLVYHHAVPSSQPAKQSHDIAAYT